MKKKKKAIKSDEDYWESVPSFPCEIINGEIVLSAETMGKIHGLGFAALGLVPEKDSNKE